jgi:hypothetical protein
LKTAIQHVPHTEHRNWLRALWDWFMAPRRRLTDDDREELKTY